MRKRLKPGQRVLNLTNLDALASGEAREALEAELLHVAHDMRTRNTPGKREVTLRFRFKPTVPDAGPVRECVAELSVGSKIPARAVALSLEIDADGQLLFDMENNAEAGDAPSDVPTDPALRALAGPDARDKTARGQGAPGNAADAPADQADEKKPKRRRKAS